MTSEVPMEQVRGVVDIIRKDGLCGALSPDAESICLLDRDHKEQHGWWAARDEVSKQLAAFFSVEYTSEEAAAAYLEAYELRTDQLEGATRSLERAREVLWDGNLSPSHRVQEALDILEEALR